ncbi:MAG: rRNA maturation RNase YbeY [Bacteroidota bacterium]
MPIEFFSKETSFKVPNSSSYKRWLHQIIREFSSNKVKDINYIFCSDDYLLAINKEYLQHDYYTDIITFDQSDNEGELEADIFISVDRIKENSFERNDSFENELSRVMAHGLLHLIGYDDKTEEEKIRMKEKEDACLSLQKQ